ncbi:alpha/beta fold hydrolase [Halocatena salina]|uniref:Alpha/beta hydrolase n=1 Tax=Halocatena salina TaxID=2934340 RepID=A0A8U0A648_9EURY|nr:alpha/beta hydrolase [Halocatena salina]UPM44645.1 alpha/beta hydrolase [Halocatena salina]
MYGSRSIWSVSTTDRLGLIDQPTFVFDGTRDPYFTELILRETAEEIPNATLSLAHGAKHGAFHERKWSFDAQVTIFLNDHSVTRFPQLRERHTERSQPGRLFTSHSLLRLWSMSINV